MLVNCFCVIPLLSNFFPCLHLLQHTSLSPNGKLLLIVGDNPECMLVDSQNGKVTLYSLFVQQPINSLIQLYPGKRSSPVFLEQEEISTIVYFLYLIYFNIYKITKKKMNSEIYLNCTHSCFF